tara:strand:- start:56 stop:196 length:141 start_codon:yes stop_codon:yes gene_type:complete
MKKVLMYMNEDKQILNPKSYARLNGGRNLSKSQLKLLGLTRIFIKE